MQHIQMRIRGHWHHHWCLVVRWNTNWANHEPWCSCRPMAGYICPFCFAINRQPKDRDNHYCGNCHMFADPYLNMVAEAPHLVRVDPRTGHLELTKEGIDTYTQPEPEEAS